MIFKSLLYFLGWYSRYLLLFKLLQNVVWNIFYYGHRFWRLGSETIVSSGATKQVFWVFSSNFQIKRSHTPQPHPHQSWPEAMTGWDFWGSWEAESVFYTRGSHILCFYSRWEVESNSVMMWFLFCYDSCSSCVKLVGFKLLLRHVMYFKMESHWPTWTSLIVLKCLL